MARKESLSVLDDWVKDCVGQTNSDFEPEKEGT